MCFGIQLTFDQPIVVKGASSQQHYQGFASGFEIWDSTGKLSQPMTLMGVPDGKPHMVQLNVTYIQPTPPAVLRYAW